MFGTLASLHRMMESYRCLYLFVCVCAGRKCTQKKCGQTRGTSALTSAAIHVENANYTPFLFQYTQYQISDGAVHMTNIH